MQKLKQNKILPVRRKKLINLDFLQNFSFKKILIIFSILLLLLSLSTFIFIFIQNLKADRFRVNNTKYLSQQDISKVTSKYSNERLLAVNTKDIENDIKSENILVKEAVVSKSLIEGIVIQVIEYEPICIIQTTDSKTFIITNKNDKIEIKEGSIAPDLVKVSYLSSNFEDPNFFKNLSNTLKIKIELDENLSGVYSFDNFGNLSILLESSKSIRLDLNERFFTIDEQVRLLQDTLAKNQSFSEIDLRFSYLLIK